MGTQELSPPGSELRAPDFGRRFAASAPPLRRPIAAADDRLGVTRSAANHRFDRRLRTSPRARVQAP